MSVLAPPRTVVELLRFTPESPRTRGFFGALERAARATDVALTITDRYHGVAPWLLLWGPGAPDRIEPMRRQLAAGGHVLCVDLAYWQRDTKVRVSIDAAHPQQWVMRRDWPASRLEADRVPIVDVWDPEGPVLIAGIGEKATVQYGPKVIAWEATMQAEARRRGLAVEYRAKRGSAIPIDRALCGVSLVCTWHSNVAVDAIRLGIPVICQDGAAAAVCPSTWTDDPQPLPVAVRDRFLANLAWFQWAPSEAAQCWTWLRELLA